VQRRASQRFKDEHVECAGEQIGFTHSTYL
jgi:hypothetical protein